MAACPTVSTSQYKLLNGPDGPTVNYTPLEDKNFLPYAELKLEVTPYKYTGPNALDVYHTTHFQVINGVHMEAAAKLGNSQYYIVVGDELMELLSLTKDVLVEGQPQSWSLVCSRGVIDTVPGWHSAGTGVYFYSQLGSAAYATFHKASQVAYKLQTISPAGVPQAIDAATKHTVTIDDRWYRPYPPGNIRISGASSDGFVTEGTPWFSKTPLIGDVGISWSHRNRVEYADKIQHQDWLGTSAEKGTTYTVMILDAAGAVKRTVPRITGTTYTYTSALATADGGGAFYLAVWAVRDEILDYDDEVAFASYQPQLIPVGRTVQDYALLTGITPTYTPETVHPVNGVIINNFQVKRGHNVTVTSPAGDRQEGRFEGTDVTLLWDTNVDDIIADPTKAKVDKSNLIDGYEIKIYVEGVDAHDTQVDHALAIDNVVADLPIGTTKDIAGKAFYIKATSLRAQEFTYTFKMNEQMGGPRRRFVFRVRAHTVNKQYSEGFTFVVENPAPVFTGVKADSYTNGIAAIDLGTTTDTDFKSVKVYYSLHTGITGDPGQEGVEIIEYTTPTFSYVNKAKGDLYFRVRAIDAFGEAGTIVMPVGNDYSVHRYKTLEEFSKEIFDSPAYKWLITPLGDLFNIKAITNLVNGQLTTINNTIGALVGLKSGVYQGKLAIDEINSNTQTFYTVVQSRIGDSNSRVMDVETTTADLHKATAEYFHELEATHGGLSGKLVQWQQAIADDVSALAKSITMLETKMKGALGEVSAGIVRVDTARVTERDAYAQELNALHAEISGANGTPGIKAELTELKQAAVGYCELGGTMRLDAATSEACAALGFCTVNDVVDASITNQAACTTANGTWTTGVWKGGLPIASSLSQAKVITDLKASADPGAIQTKVDASIQQTLLTVQQDLSTLSNRWGVQANQVYTDPQGNKHTAISGLVLDQRLNVNQAGQLKSTSWMVFAADKFAIVPSLHIGADVVPGPVDVTNVDATLVPFGIDTDPISGASKVYIKDAFVKKLEVEKLDGDVSKFKPSRQDLHQEYITNGLTQIGVASTIGHTVHKDGHYVSASIYVNTGHVTSGYGILNFVATLSEVGGGQTTSMDINFDTAATNGASWMVAFPNRTPKGKQVQCVVTAQGLEGRPSTFNVGTLYIELKGLRDWIRV